MGVRRAVTSAALCVCAICLLASSCSDDSTGPESPQGIVLVEVYPTGSHFHWELFRDDESLGEFSGSRTRYSMADGEYRLEWKPEEGWATPTENPQSGFIRDGSALRFAGVYHSPSSPAVVRINVEPDFLNAGWSLDMPGGVRAEGTGDQTLLGVPAGHYRIEFDDEPGWSVSTQNPIEADLEELEDETFQAIYEQAPGGSFIRVQVEPPALPAPWSLLCANGATMLGQGSLLLTGMTPGDYTIQWLPIDGWQQPEDNVVTLHLGDGSWIAFDGEFQYSGATGDVEIEIQPVGCPAPWHLDGPYGLTWDGVGAELLPALPTGLYSAEFAEVGGYLGPAESQDLFVLSAGHTVTTSAEFEVDVLWPNGRIGLYGDSEATQRVVSIPPFELTQLYLVYTFPLTEDSESRILFRVSPTIYPGDNGVSSWDWLGAYHFLWNGWHELLRDFAPDAGRHCLLARLDLVSTDPEWPPADTLIRVQAYVSELLPPNSVPTDTLWVNSSP